MGKVIISAKIENLFDIEEVFKGQITDDQVRRLEIDDAMVDTGATTLSLPKRLIAELGLRQLRTGHLQAPVGKMLVAAVCSLSRRGRPLKEVHQGDNGCVIEATLPPGLRALEGQIALSIERQNHGTSVDATVKIPGQKFDWGVSKKCIDELFDDLHVLLN